MNTSFLRGASVAALVAGLLSLAPAAQAAVQIQWGSWTLYSQEQPNWCWAAGAKIIVQHEKGSSSSECQFVKWGLGTSGCANSSGTLDQVVAAMRKGGLSNPGAYWAGTPYWTDIRSETLAGHGALERVVWGPTYSVGHIAPIVGTQLQGSTPYIYLVYIQNTTVSGSWVSWDSFLSGTTGLGGSSYRPTQYIMGMRA